MAEQPKEDSTVVETTQPETEVVETTDVDDIDKSLDREWEVAYPTKDAETIPAKKQSEVREELAPDPKIEGTKGIEQKEEQKEETSEEVIELKIEDLTIKRKDEVIPIMTVLQEFHKAGQLQEFVDDYTSKRFDYYSKTQEHSKNVKDFDAGIEAQKSRMEAIEYKNFAMSIGEENLKTKDYFENTLDGEGNPKYDDPDKAFTNYMSDVKKKGTEYVGKVNETMQINNEYLKNFGNKHGLSFDECEKEFLPQLREYLNPTIAQGQMPLKEDTFDVFYKGMNHEKLVAEAIEKAVKEKAKSIYSEVESTSIKSEEPIQSTQMQSATETDEDFIELERQFNEQT